MLKSIEDLKKQILGFLNHLWKHFKPMFKKRKKKEPTPDLWLEKDRDQVVAEIADAVVIEVSTVSPKSMVSKMNEAPFKRKLKNKIKEVL